MSLQRAKERNKATQPADGAPPCTTCASRRVLTVEGNRFAYAIPCQTCSKSCEHCDNTGYLFVDNAYGSVDSAPCPLCSPIRRRIRLYNNARIPRRYALLEFSDFQYRNNPSLINVVTEFRSILQTFKPGDRGLGLSGGVGVGKTMLMALFLRYMTLNREIPSRFIEFSHLLSDIRAGYSKGRSDSEILGELVSVPILVIDEMGKALKTEWQTDILDGLISRRYNSGVSTFFTTNFPFHSHQRESGVIAQDDFKVSTLHERIGSRMYSRLDEMCEFHTIEASDHREQLG